jgi:hypothetical protein
MKRTTVSLNQTWEGTAVKILQLSNTLKKDIVPLFIKKQIIVNRLLHSYRYKLMVN